MDKSLAKQIQRALKETVAPTIKVDGDFGPTSLGFLRDFAATHGVSSDEATKLLQRYADIRYVSDDAFAQAAKSLGVPQSYVRSIAQVESAGASFLADGRVKILFERHWFYKKLLEALQRSTVRDHVVKKLNWAVPVASLTAATVISMVSKTWPALCNQERGGYTKDKEWERLESAMDLDTEAACQSASYGGYQIMGFNHIAAGYKSAREMMIAFAQSESCQFLGLIAFIKANPTMWNALKAGNWAGFAKAYNGSAYAENKYDTKLAAAELQWRPENVA